MTRILVVDNYDSFVYTLVGYLAELGADPTVVRNDAIPAVGDRAGYDGVLISPGPGTPAGAGGSMELIGWCAEMGLPMLGVCLGHQALGEVFGGTVAHAPELMHGKTSAIVHDGTGVFEGLVSPLTATRYHSLAIVPETVPDMLRVTAWTGQGAPIIMGVQHRDLPLYGVQFHPESVLTEGGYRMIGNWLAVCGASDAVERSMGMVPLLRG